MNKTHGMTKTKTYSSWKSMKERCLKSYHVNHAYYKDKKICKRWLESFSNFLLDMGVRPKNTSLDRVDNSKGYNKKNCRWASLSVQNSNKACYSNTGYKYISKSGQHRVNGVFKYPIFFVNAQNDTNRISSTFKTIEEALVFRQMIFNSGYINKEFLQSIKEKR